MNIEEFNALGILPGDPVLVFWLDIWEEDNICEDADLCAVHCESVGWFDRFSCISKKGTALVIVKERRDKMVDKQAFPIGCVTDVVKLEMKR